MFACVEPTPRQLTAWWGYGAQKSAGMHPEAVWKTTDRNRQAWNERAQLMFFRRIIKDGFDLQ